MKKFAVIALLTLLSIAAGAQTTLGNGEMRGSGAPARKGETVKGIRMTDVKPLPLDYSKYTKNYGRQDDSRQKLKDEAIMDRDWDNDETAWNTACALDTKAAYQKYVMKYPIGVHRAEADKKIIDFDVDEIFNGDHGELPQMNRTKEDDKSPTSNLVIENTTEYVMTLYFSGTECKKVMINPKGKVRIKIKNGSYRVAAEVPVQTIHPYAGRQDFRGGDYETGYCIVPYVE